MASKVHYEFEESACGCGDSYCSDCRERIRRTACGAPTRSSSERTEDVSRVTCSKCLASKRLKGQRSAEEASTRAEAAPLYQNIERCCQLHEDLHVYYVVDGYHVELTTGDSADLVCFRVDGDSLHDALLRLDQALAKETLESVRARGWSGNLVEILRP